MAEAMREDQVLSYPFRSFSLSSSHEDEAVMDTEAAARRRQEKRCEGPAKALQYGQPDKASEYVEPAVAEEYEVPRNRTLAEVMEFGFSKDEEEEWMGDYE